MEGDPDLSVEHDDDYTTVWALADTGSAAHVADHSKHFPGAILDATQAGARYTAANGTTFDNKGYFDVDRHTENHHKKHTRFAHGKVSMPILSIRLWAQDGHRNIFDADSGETIHLATGETDPIHGKLGAYFVKMILDPDIVEGADSPFVRPGIHG